MALIECHSTQYQPDKVTHRDGVVHLYDYLSAGFPLCGHNSFPDKNAIPIKECGFCVEAAERWIKTLQYNEKNNLPPAV